MNSALCSRISAALGAPVDDIHRVGGGDINQAARIQVGGEQLFVKYHSAPPGGMFAREADGLEALRAVGALRVPEVVAVGDDFLVMEWIGGRGRAHDFDQRLGQGLAAIHSSTLSAAGQPAPPFGFEGDNFIGTLPQKNPESASWVEFFGRMRLGAQLELGSRGGRFESGLLARGERLIERLDDLIPDDADPALLHGDLWGGNFMVGADGEPVLIDPAVYRGHREVEIAFTQLFGGFGKRFYVAYDSTWPLEPGFSERRDLYNLYPVLVHANLFGGHYITRADQMIRAYL